MDNNNDYVLRSDVLEIAMEWCPDDDGSVGKVGDLREMLDEIESIPAADVEPVRHGYYIGTEFDGYADGNPVYYEWECSECGCVFEDDEPKYRYCPNCGAKMDAEPVKEDCDAE